MENQEKLTKEQVEQQIHIAKKLFIETISDVGNRCEKKIAIEISLKPDPYFFNSGERHPFNIEISDKLPYRPIFIMGS